LTEPDKRENYGNMKYFPFFFAFALLNPLWCQETKPAEAKPAASEAVAVPAAGDQVSKERRKKKEGKEMREKGGQEVKQEEPKPAPAPAPANSGKERTAVTNHTLQMGDRKLDYKATAGTLTLSKADGSPRANVFYVAYTLPPANGEKRPVTFCFNGGPGSSAVWLHLGAFGPRRVVLPDSGTEAAKPPFTLTNNEHSLLDVSDLVFIDPVSTGYSRPEKEDEAKQFHGFNEDIESVGDFIRLYVSRNELWAAPKFLMGESYGAVRAGGLSNHLQSRYGMWLNGVIIVSGLFDFHTLDGDGSTDLPFICAVPTMACVAHYHKKLSPERQADFAGTLKAADAFAEGPYATALLRGGALPEEDRQKIAGELSSLIGLPKDLILRENLRISAFLFFEKLLEAENKQIGRFDARVVGEPGTGDPSYNVVFGAYASTLNSYVRSDLKFVEDRPYEILSRAVQPWNYSSFTNEYVSVTGDLARALKSNPSMGVYVACGYYDMATMMRGIRYSVDHLNISPKLRENFKYGYYEGGHMMYTNLEDLKRLGEEVRLFVKERK
jgi:carboxypeptidase C (cathepsin A)